MTRTTIVIFMIFFFSFCKKKSDPEPIQEWPPCELRSEVLFGADTIFRYFTSYSFCQRDIHGNIFIKGEPVWPMDGIYFDFQKPELTVGKYKVSAEPSNKDEVSVRIVYEQKWRTNGAIEGERRLTAVSGTLYVNKLTSGRDSFTICDGIAIDENGVEEAFTANITIDCYYHLNIKN